MDAPAFELRTWQTRARKRQQIVCLLEKKIAKTTDAEELLELHTQLHDAMLLLQHAIRQVQHYEALRVREEA